MFFKKPKEVKTTYSMVIGCSNCHRRSQVEIPLGTQAVDYNIICPNCETSGDVYIPNIQDR